MHLGEVHQLNVRTVTLLGQPASSPTILSLPAETPSSTVSILGYYTPPADSSTSSGTDNAANSSKSSSKTPIIVGATIGGVVFLGIVAYLAWFFLRRRAGRRPYSRATTPMLRKDGEEKRGLQATPDSGAMRGSVGAMFTPFGAGYSQAPIDEDPYGGARDSMEIEEGGTFEPPIPNEEKRALFQPPEDEHPAYHPLPGKNVPAYVPGQPAYNSLPSQRSQRSLEPPAPVASLVPEQSPKIPGLIFTPIDISLGETQLDTIPITPKAELAASPVNPTPEPSQTQASIPKPPSSPIPSSKFSTSRRSPPPSSPPKSSVSPASLPKVATTRSPLTNFSMKHVSVPRPGFPSPTAGGKIELPASLPHAEAPAVSDAPVKAPLNPTPAFHHIYLPESVSKGSGGSRDTAYSTIPIGLGDEKAGSSARGLNIRDGQKQSKSSNLRQEHNRSPESKQEKRSQASHERKASYQYSREQGSPPQGKKRAPSAPREPRSSPPPTQEVDVSPPMPLVLSETHPALRDQVRAVTPPKQRKRSHSNQQTRSPPREERQSPPPLRQQRSDISAMSDTSYALREQPSEVSMATVSEESEVPAARPRPKKKWSASERDGMSLLVYKGDAPVRKDEVSPLYTPSRGNAQLSEESDMSIQPLALQSREGWSAVPLTPMTPLNKTKVQKRADNMF